MDRIHRRHGDFAGSQLLYRRHPARQRASVMKDLNRIFQEGGGETIDAKVGPAQRGASCLVGLQPTSNPRKANVQNDLDG